MLRRILYTIFTLLLIAPAVNAQRLVIGEKAPDIRVGEWYKGNSASTSGTAVLLDFFHSSNDQCVRALPRLNTIQKDYSGKLNVIVITKESMSSVSPYLDGKDYSFYLGNDEGGKTFNSFNVRLVPFSVLLDGSGKVAWTGNVGSLTDDIIRRALR